MKTKKHRVLYVSGIFDYGQSVSGSYILYQILRKVKNIDLTVLPLFPHTIHPIDVNQFLPYLHNYRNLSSEEIIKVLPEHDFIFISRKSFYATFTVGRSSSASNWLNSLNSFIGKRNRKENQDFSKR